MKKIINEIKNSNQIKNLINKANKYRNLNPSVVKKFENRIQTQNQIFNLSHFNQSYLESIDKFYHVPNEQKYIVDDIKERLKAVKI